MSGIVGIINLDGEPIDPKLLERMMDLLSCRGPDGKQTWLNGHVGFGHSLLRTTRESKREKQPFTLEGQVWITADVRIDGREDLIHELQSAGYHPSKDATDPELILQAYHAWGEHCLEHLLGDFSFGIWDARTRHLFCARDHFGIKRFYYSQSNGNFIFSNTLRCVRLSPAVSGKLNDAAIADFLLFGSNQNPGTTTFSDIQRLPAGHFLVWLDGQFRIGQYWSLPVEEPIFYKRTGDYVEHFQDLLRRSVRDRLRTDHVGVFMSGGLDSTALTATAQAVLSAESSSYDLRAYTVVYDWLMPDDERRYAGLVADRLHIPVHYLAADDYHFYQRWDQPELRPPEPVHNPLGLALYQDLFTQISAHSRVMLYGEGPDNAMHYEWQPYVLYLLKTFQWRRLLRDVWWHVRLHRRLPTLGQLRGLISGFRAGKNMATHPSWIRPELLNLTRSQGAKPRRLHPYHPVAHGSLIGPLWDALFERFDPGITSFPVEVRHPYMDVRLIRYLLALPPIPWDREKYLIRRSFQGILPEAVLRRHKTPLQCDPLCERAKIAGLPQWAPDPSLFRYVDPDKVNPSLNSGTAALWEDLRPVSLNLFLALNKWDMQ